MAFSGKISRGAPPRRSHRAIEGGVDKLKRRREEAENGVVLHGGLYGPPYELLVGQNGGHGFSGKVISIIH